MLRHLVIGWLALALGVFELHARGGGGCLQQGTLVDTPAGPVPVENLRVGDPVWGWVNGERAPATVEAVYAVEPDSYVELSAGSAQLRLTAEHPVQTEPGVFMRADRLQPGQLLAHAGIVFPRETRVALTATRKIPGGIPAYNLMVSPGGVYFANGIAVHNKGCFLPDTPVTMGDGSRRAISTVHEGDIVLAFDGDGKIVRARVNHVLTHDVASYLVLRTAHVEVHVTEEHPFYVGAGTFKTAEALRAGDPVFVYDGRVLAPQPVLTLDHVVANVRVYNLQTDEPHTFLANGVAVHNKGGGFSGGFSGSSFGGSHYRSSSGSGSGDAPWAFIGLLILIFWGVSLAMKSSNGTPSGGAGDENLDYCFSRKAIDAKAVKTLELLRFISKTDPAWNPDALKMQARAVFVELQACWMKRDYAPMEPLLMRNLYDEHCAELRGLVQTHEINRIDGLKVDAVDIVQLNYTENKADRVFAALITATARDYYTDDRTGGVIRGDDALAQFQEFWTFQLCDGHWKLREIEQSKESDLLTKENFFEPFTDTGRDQIYGAAAGKSGPAGPALPEAVQSKTQKIDRLLNFLVQTDKLWNQNDMLATARRVFTSLELAWQDGRPEMLTGVAIDEAFAVELRASLAANQRNDLKIELRNFCVRKVEIVLVNNRDDRTADEFTARISAHAQTIITRGGVEGRHDEDVKPWTDFWTFGRDHAGTGWALRAIQPEANGGFIIASQNTDEGSSQEMLEWYYSKTRAS